MRWAFWLACACYAPHEAVGVPCSTTGRCPSDQVCDPTSLRCVSTLPADAMVPPADAVDAAMHAGTDAAVAITTTTLGTASSAASGTTVALLVEQSAATGTLVVVTVGARGQAPVTISDSRGNAWLTEVETGNASDVVVAGVYSATLKVALAQGDTITATVSGTANTQLRSIAAVAVTGASTLDQVGSGQPTATTLPSVTTAGAVTASSELLVGVIATGFNTADTFTPQGGFASVLDYGGTFSSGSLETRIVDGATGKQTFATQTVQGGSAAYAQVVATFR